MSSPALSLDAVPQFWQGVAASVLATVTIAVAVRLYRAYSIWSRRGDEQAARQLSSVKAKLASPEPLVRVEGLLIALFSLMAFFAVALVLWVIGSMAALFASSLIVLCLYFLSVVFLAVGVYWIQDIVTTPNSLVLLTASYGAGSDRIDVLGTLLRHVHNDRLHLCVGNDLAGDPAPDAVKDLVVVFSYRGSQRTRKVTEGETLSIP